MTNTISTPNSTYTELNRGTGGSKMDETLVTQVDPNTLVGTVVHRERVVLGLDTGELVGRPDANGTDLPTTDRLAIQLLQQILAELKDISRILMKTR